MMNGRNIFYYYFNSVANGSIIIVFAKNKYCKKKVWLFLIIETSGYNKK